MTITLDPSELLPPNYEPKRKFRWILRIPGIPSQFIKGSGGLSYSCDYASVGGTAIKRFRPVTVKIYDSIRPNAAKCVEGLMRTPGILGDTYIDMLDSVGAIVDRWTLKESHILSVNYSDLNYSDSDACVITLELGYSDVKLDVQDGIETNNLWTIEEDR